ncbi:glycosyl hydrolase family 32 [Agromyces neolithicus]|uniref:beta-fructofuranosidase n=1 Tax=Agromyces neolithicus TaxID=269420 RepID=A0ABP4YPJ1_9MICO
MHQLHYQPEGVWFGDCMPFFANGQFYLFHQRDTRKPGPFGEPFGWALATTKDFVEYEDHGESLERGGDDEQDQFIFAGSVFEAEGRYHAMYTGYNRDYPEQGKASQVLMLATSDDLLTWEKSDRKLVPPQSGYDPDDWRDPYVIWDAEASEYLMILGSRKDGERVLTGSTVAFTSTDLENWTFQGDFWAPGLYSMHEMPDLFQMGEYWYLLTTEYSDKCKTVYRMSRSLSGPWSAPVDDAFDGRAYYAARSASDGEHRYLFGWVPTKAGDDDAARWEWGGTLVVHEVLQRPDGSLAAGIPDGVRAAFAPPTAIADGPIAVAAADGVAERVLVDDAGELFHLSFALRVAPGTRSVSLRLLENVSTGQGYEYRIDAGENRLVFDRRPNYPWYQYDNRGLERPLALEPGTEHRVDLIVDGSIATLYVDGVALNARMNTVPGHAIVLSSVDGGVEIWDATIAKGLAA